MLRAIQEFAVIVVCAALVGVPVGLWLTGAVPPVAQWGASNGE